MSRANPKVYDIRLGLDELANLTGPALRRSVNDEVRVLFDGERLAVADQFARELQNRTAMTTSNSSALNAQSQPLVGVPDLGAALSSVVNRQPAGGTVSDANMSLPGAQDVAEGGTLSSSLGSVTSSGQLGATHSMAMVTYTRQMERQPGVTSTAQLATQRAAGFRMDVGIASTLNADTRPYAIAVSAGVPSLANLAAAVEKAANNGVPPDRGVWWTSPGGYRVLQLLQTNQQYFARGGEILGRPAIITSAMPENLGGGTNETLLCYGDPTAITLSIWSVYQIEDRLTQKKQGLIEYLAGVLHRTTIPNPERIVKVTGITTS